MTERHLIIETVVDDWIDTFCRHLRNTPAMENLIASLDAQIQQLEDYKPKEGAIERRGYE